ncbi:MAG: hypothetical protein IKK48_05070 [Firmicutes bacterium]|nr:hypothetical protein [Bacillota bacterium]
MNGKQKKRSRIVALLMVFMMVFSMMPTMAFAAPVDDAPFSVTVNGEGITNIDESTLTWESMWGGSSEVICYTVTVPEDSTEAKLLFDGEKQWSYYDSKGTYIGAGPTSWTASTEHTVAIQDSNSDGDFDGISVQIPNAYSTEYYILFVYGSAAEDNTKPFDSIYIGDKVVAEENIAYKGIFELGDYAEDEQQGVNDSYDYVHEVPYYQVTVPCGTESVDVTYPADADIMNFPPDAYGYKTDLGIDAMTSATVKGMTFKNAYTKNSDGTQTVTTPVKGYAFDADGNGHAITLEGADTPFAALCLFSFIYDGVNHVYVDGVCSCGAEEPIEVEIPEGLNLERISPVTAIEAGENITFSLWGMENSAPSYVATVPEGTETVELTFKSGTHPAPYSNKISGSMLSYNEEDESYSASGTESSASQGEDGLYTITLNAAEMIRNGKYYGAYDASYNTLYVLTFKYPEGAHEHSYDDGVITTKPTCNEPGVKTFTCSGCEEGTEGHSYTEEVKKTGHNYDAGVETKAATCAEEGVKTFTCQNEGCTAETEGHTKTEKINKKAHTYDEGVVNPQPTCTEAGTRTYTCSVCPAETSGHTKTETVAKLGHDYDNPERKCSRCGDVAPAQDENGVYQLGTAEEMLWFAKKVNSGENRALKGAITADITLDENWPGIGNGKAFKGSLDGQNHTITLNGSTFGIVATAEGSKSTYIQIKNIITEGSVQCAAVVNSANYVAVDHCINKADVGGNGENNSVAGIVGSAKNGITIQNCGNEGRVKGNKNVAGILGNGYMAGAQITNCYNKGAISGTDEVGGIAGYIQGYPSTANVVNSYNTGKVSGTSKTGGIVGNLYNNSNIKNCYNTGESTYAIAGNIYNNTAKITDTYYRGDLCSASVPNKTQNTGTYTGNRGIAATSVEMSSEDIATALGDAFKQSCPSPVFTAQKSCEHTMKDDVCQICKYGNDMPVEYKVNFVLPDGAEIAGDTTFRVGNDYSFRVDILDGYYKADNFAVSVDNKVVEPDADGNYFVEQPTGPFYITVTGVKQYEGVLPISLPGTGSGYRVNPCEGYDTTVESGNDFKFTVDFVEGFEAGKNFAVKVNGEKVTPDSDGIYTIENILLAQTITVEDVNAIPGRASVTIAIDYTKGEKEFLEAEETDEIMMGKQIEIPYFDLELYDYEKYYYNPYCYVDEEGNIRGQQKAGTPESAYNVVTSMHAFIYMTEIYYLGYELEDAGTGYSDTIDTDEDGISDFDEAVSWTQGAGSTFMNLWGLGTNLNYHLNYVYPIAYPEWGSTSDQQALKDGDLLSIHMIQGSASGSAFGLFAVNDDNNEYNRTEECDTATVKQGESVKLTHYLATQGDKYTTEFVTVPDKDLYWVEAGDETADVTTWNKDDFGSFMANTFKTDENGEIVIDTTGVEPGTYYIGAVGGLEKGIGFAGRGAESGPAYFKLIIEEDTEAAALAKAKEEAKAEIEGYKDADDYRDAQKAELAAAVEAAKTAIDAAASEAEVTAAVEAAKEAMDAIKTDAELKAEEEAAALAKAKEEAKAEIEGYKDADDYRDAEKTELAAAVEAAKTAIDAAESVEEVAAAVEAAKEAMDAIKTDADLKAEEEADKEDDSDKDNSQPSDKVEDKHTVDIDVDSYEVFSGDVLTVVGNGEFNDFLEVLMDGKVVDSKHYVVKEGSTILTFTSTYLDTLEPGKHTVEMVWKTGRASEEILIVSAEVPAEKEPVDKAESAKDSEKESENPNTGDMSHPFFYLAVLFMAGAAAVALRRKED